MLRRDFLRMLGIGAAAAVLPALPEPEPELIEEPRKKLWAVPSNAPFGSRIERASSLSNWSQVFKDRYGKFINPLPAESTIADCSLFAVDARDFATWRGQNFAADSGILTKAKIERAVELYKAEWYRSGGDAWT